MWCPTSAKCACAKVINSKPWQNTMVRSVSCIVETYKDLMRSQSKPPKRVKNPTPPPNVNPEMPMEGVEPTGNAAIDKSSCDQ